MALRAGDQVDRYTLEEMIGEGGQAEVWRARDRYSPARALALKLVDLADTDPVQVERVRREARHLARLSHPALPTCHALVEDLRLGLLAIALDLVEGQSLTAALASPGLNEAERRVVLRQVAAGLACMHSAGVIHRDVKPDNIILAPDFRLLPERPGAVKLIDLGIAIQSGNPQPLTVIGHIIGTAEYLAPEQLDPRYHQAIGSTPAADVFALGVLGWQLIYGVHPTGLPDGSSLEAYALAYRRADAEVVWPAPVRPGALEQALRRCLAVRARDRLPTAVEASSMLFAIDGLPQPSVDLSSRPSFASQPSFLPPPSFSPQPPFASQPSFLPADGRLSSLPPTSIDVLPSTRLDGPGSSPSAPPAGPGSSLSARLDGPGSSLSAPPAGPSSAWSTPDTVPDRPSFQVPEGPGSTAPMGPLDRPSFVPASSPHAPPEPAPSAPVPATIFAPPPGLSSAPPVATVMQTSPRGGMQPGYQATPAPAPSTELFAPRAPAPLAAPRGAPSGPSRPSRGSSRGAHSTPSDSTSLPAKKPSVLLYLLAFVVIGLGAGAVAILALFAFVMLRLAR